jgi:hypothetical protein
MDTTRVRRRPDGSIDFDFYRARAAALRTQALRDAFRPKAVFRFTLIAIAGLTAFALATASQTAQAGGW